MSTVSPPNLKAKGKLALVIVAYAAFCGLSFLARFVPCAFLAVLFAGIAFPLAWAQFTRDWNALGFTRQNGGQALVWGIGAGAVTSIAAFLTAQERSLAPALGLQLAIGIPLWLLIMSPFQEFFFRGWMQSHLQDALGQWAGLLVANACFTAWHFFPPLVGTPTSSLPINTLPGVIATFSVGLAFGYSFQRTRNIAAPWLAHALSGITLVVLGTMQFVQYT